MALIYHYCSSQTFLKIIENKEIWLSASNNMNDAAEGVWYKDCIKNVLNMNVDYLGVDFCNLIINSCEFLHTPKYISCFSLDGDSLSQWRAYADDGSGVAIGFDEDCLDANSDLPIGNLKPLDSLNISKVRYVSKVDIELEIKNQLERVKDENADNDTCNFLLSNYFYLNYMTIKNIAFEEENEKRLIYTPIVEIESGNFLNKLGDLKFRVSSGLLTSYLEHKFNSLAIKSIVLGPKNKFSDNDLSMFLNHHELGDVTYKRSEATYR